MSKTVRIGVTVRAEDFPSHRDCYVEGRVTGVTKSTMVFMITRDVWEGKEMTGAQSRVGEACYTSLPGENLIEWDTRITVLS